MQLAMTKTTWAHEVNDAKVSDSLRKKLRLLILDYFHTTRFANVTEVEMDQIRAEISEIIIDGIHLELVQDQGVIKLRSKELVL